MEFCYGDEVILAKLAFLLLEDLILNNGIKLKTSWWDDSNANEIIQVGLVFCIIRLAGMV